MRKIQSLSGARPIEASGWRAAVPRPAGAPAGEAGAPNQPPRWTLASTAQDRIGRDDNSGMLQFTFLGQTTALPNSEYTSALTDQECPDARRAARQLELLITC